MVCYQFVVKCQGIYQFLICGEVFCMGVKMFKQKGMGCVCYYFVCVLQFCGGGKVYGLVFCDYFYDLLKKVCVLVLCYVLFVKVKVEELIIVDNLVVNEVKIKVFVGVFVGFGLINVFIIGGVEFDVNFKLVVQNILNIDVFLVQGINVYDILCCGKFVFFKVVVEVLEEWFK